MCFLSVICPLSRTVHACLIEKRKGRFRPALHYLALGAPEDVSNDTEQPERCMLGDVVFLFTL